MVRRGAAATTAPSGASSSPRSPSPTATAHTSIPGDAAIRTARSAPAGRPRPALKPPADQAERPGGAGAGRVRQRAISGLRGGTRGRGGHLFIAAYLHWRIPLPSFLSRDRTAHRQPPYFSPSEPRKSQGGCELHGAPPGPHSVALLRRRVRGRPARAQHRFRRKAGDSNQAADRPGSAAPRG